ncbi:MAG: hypothetical protein QOI24_3338 [Acidobacteriota bacterium]|jgi:tetratricopeptide (TPR) repeat protein|nr:hypothetical protein [Acidobacteriota bacterium]
MTAQHYSDEQLLELPPHHEHLATCSACAGALTHIQQLAATLVDEIVWDEEPLPDTPRASTVATLRTIATQMDAEDADAERYVAELLATPREQWLSVLSLNPHYRTPGLVRRLIVETDRLIDSRPADVVEITAVAVDVADGLAAASWYGDTVPRLRGAAWRERAYALYYVGRHVEALAAADRAAGHLAWVAVAEFDSARLMLVRALVLRELEQFDRALAASNSTAEIFQRFGDEKRQFYVLGVQALVAYAARDYRRALPLFDALANHARESADWRTYAMMKQNMAGCYRELRQNEDALRSFGEAVTLFDKLGMEVDRVRATWHVGRVLLLEGRYSEASRLLCTVKDNYERLNVYDKAAMAAVDGAEASLMLGRGTEVMELCRHAVQFFERSGVPYSQNAMTALSLMHEAAQSGALDSIAVRRVRNYLEILPHRPTLLFAYASE